MGFFNDILGKTQARAQENARTSLIGDRNEALSNLTTGAQQAETNVRQGVDSARQFLNQGFDTARSDIRGGGANALGQFDSLESLGGRFGGGTNLYMDSLGINGGDGNQRAVNAFQTGPGFNFALDQGIDAISRRNAAQGLNQSGNADRDAQIFGQGLANQEYGNFQNRLSQFAPLELSATQGVAQGRSGISERQGTSLANLASNNFNNQANLQSQQGLTLADLARGLSRDRANVITAQSGPISERITDAAAARGAGAANLVNLGIDAASMLAGLPPIGSLSSASKSGG